MALSRRTATSMRARDSALVRGRTQDPPCLSRDGRTILPAPHGCRVESVLRVEAVTDKGLAKLRRTLGVAFRHHPDYLRPLLDPVAARSVPWASGVAHSKRLLEYWMADREFRAALPNDPAGTVSRYGLRADPEAVRFLWDDAFHRDRLGRADWTAPEAVQQYRAWIGEKLLY